MIHKQSVWLALIVVLTALLLSLLLQWLERLRAVALLLAPPQ
jgi:hypothetical protein